jgi:hypothetical protein
MGCGLYIGSLAASVNSECLVLYTTGNELLRSRVVLPEKKKRVFVQMDARRERGAKSRGRRRAEYRWSQTEPGIKYHGPRFQKNEGTAGFAGASTVAIDPAGPQELGGWTLI